MRVAVTLEQCWHRVPGGTARSAIEQAAALARLDDGGAVELVGVAARHREPAPDEWAPPIPVRQLPLPRPLLYRSWHALGWPTVEQVTGPVDAVHATAMAIPATKAPLVVTVHDLAFLDDPSVATARGLRFFRRAIELARERAQLLLCPSETTIAECVRAGFDPELLRLVPWGVRTFDVDDRAKAAVRERYQLDRRFILFCGTLEPRKNLRRLLEAFTKLELDDVDLVLAGWHGWDAAIEPLIAATQGRARAIGAVPESDLRGLFELADVVCYPSVREGFGLPVLEAMAQGAAVVTSATTATAEVAGDAALTVDPLDVDAIAGALRRVLDDPALAARLGDAGRERAAGYTWERTARLTLDAYREVVEA